MEKEDQLRVGKETDRAMWRRKINAESGCQETDRQVRCGEGRSAESGP